MGHFHLPPQDGAAGDPPNPSHPAPPSLPPAVPPEDPLCRGSPEPTSTAHHADWPAATSFGGPGWTTPSRVRRTVGLGLGLGLHRQEKCPPRCPTSWEWGTTGLALGWDPKALSGAGGGHPQHVCGEDGGTLHEGARHAAQRAGKGPSSQQTRFGLLHPRGSHKPCRCRGST